MSRIVALLAAADGQGMGADMKQLVAALAAADKLDQAAAIFCDYLAALDANPDDLFFDESVAVAAYMLAAVYLKQARLADAEATMRRSLACFAEALKSMDGHFAVLSSFADALSQCRLLADGLDAAMGISAAVAFTDFAASCIRATCLGASGPQCGPFLSAAAARRRRHFCAFPECAAQSGLRTCAACGLVKYCTPEHQRGDWRAHKAECVRNRVAPAGALAAATESAAAIDPAAATRPASGPETIASPTGDSNPASS
jgi:hypothetical protein